MKQDNRNTTHTLESALTGLLDRVEKIENFVLAEAPDIVKDIVKIEYVKLQNKMISLALYLAITISYIYVYLSKVMIAEDDTNLVWTAGGIVAALAALFTLIAMAESMYCLLTYREMKASDKLVALNGIAKVMKLSLIHI